MPQISYFLGISIYVQFYDHNPPHIHAVYNAYKATYSINNGKILAGEMSPKAHRLIQEWIKTRKDDLMKVCN